MTTIHIRATGARIRVWCESEKFALGPNKRVLDSIFWSSTNLWDMDAKQKKLVKDDTRMAKYVLKCVENDVPEMVAVEYVNSHGAGVVLYPDWK